MPRIIAPKLGKKIINELKLINENNLNILKKKENEIKKIEDEINSQKNILSKDELKIKIEKYKKKITEFNNNKNCNNDRFLIYGGICKILS